MNIAMDIYVYAQYHEKAGDICAEPEQFSPYDIIKFSGSVDVLTEKAKELVNSGIENNKMYDVKTGISILKEICRF